MKTWQSYDLRPSAEDAIYMRRCLNPQCSISIRRGRRTKGSGRQFSFILTTLKLRFPGPPLVVCMGAKSGCNERFETKLVGPPKQHNVTYYFFVCAVSWASCTWALQAAADAHGKSSLICVCFAIRGQGVSPFFCFSSGPMKCFRNL